MNVLFMNVTIPYSTFRNYLKMNAVTVKFCLRIVEVGTNLIEKCFSFLVQIQKPR